MGGGTGARAFLKDHGGQVSRRPDRRHALGHRGRPRQGGAQRPVGGHLHRTLKNFPPSCLRGRLGGSARVLELKGPKLEQKEPETFTPAEEKRLLSALQDRPRALMLTELMLRTGLRLQEVANLTVDERHG